MKVMILIIGMFFFLFSGAMLVVTTSVWDTLTPKARISFLMLILTGLGGAVYIFIKVFTFGL
jgi:hypothetical protein